MPALLAGALAAWAAQQHLQSLARDLQEQHRVVMRPVIVADRDLTIGTRLTSEHLAVRQMPAEWLPSDVLAPDDFPVIDRATLQQPVPRGDPILWAYLLAAPDRFSTQLATGRRAVTIPVDDINSLAGMLQPGDSIDLYVSFDHRGERMTAALLQNMRVLATGSQHGADHWLQGEARFATVTLDASPEEAARLIAARQQGTISAMLRHDEDRDTAQTAVRGNLAELLGLSQPISPARHKAPIPVIFGDRHPTRIPHLGESGLAAEPAQSASWSLPEGHTASTGVAAPPPYWPTPPAEASHYPPPGSALTTEASPWLRP